MLFKCFTLAKLNIMINFHIINFHINIANIINFFIAAADGRQTLCVLCHLIQGLCYDERFVVAEPAVPGLVTSSFSLALDDWFETWSWSSLSPATVIF